MYSCTTVTQASEAAMLVIDPNGAAQRYEANITLEEDLYQLIELLPANQNESYTMNFLLMFVGNRQNYLRVYADKKLCNYIASNTSYTCTI
jgi:hypothetical protein